MAQHRKPHVQVLRKIGECADGKVCPTAAKLDTRPGMTFVVGKVDLDLTADELAAISEHVGHGEAFIAVPDELLPEMQT
jgi:hypothetical protein